MDLAELSALHSAAGDEHAVLAAALDSAAPVLDVHHPFRAVLRAVSRATLDITKVRVLPAIFGSARLENELERVEVDVPQNMVAKKGGVVRVLVNVVFAGKAKRRNMTREH